MQFELLFDSGGHSGPYSSVDIAINYAINLLRGCWHMRSVKVVPRTEKVITEERPSAVVKKWEDRDHISHIEIEKM